MEIRRFSGAAVDLVEWLEDVELMRAMAKQTADYFNTAPDPVLGMFSHDLAFRIVHQLAGRTLYNSARELKAGDLIDLGNTYNKADHQRGRMVARVLAEADKPAEYAHYLVFEHTYAVHPD